MKENMKRLSREMKCKSDELVHFERNRERLVAEMMHGGYEKHPAKLDDLLASDFELNHPYGTIPTEVRGRCP